MEKKSKVIDLTGMVFGMLTVVDRAEDYVTLKGQHQRVWRCRCACGNTCNVRSGSLKSGNTRSCGCYRDERVSECHKKFNEYKIVDDYIVAKTSNGIEFYLDVDDKWVLDSCCFHANPNGYLLARDCNSGKFVSLHRLIMNCQNDCVVDHIDGDPLNNRKSNLRIVTQSQNCMNRRARSNNTSGITGVSFNRSVGKWQSTIFINGKSIHLGLFSNIEDAVAARRAAEEKYFSEYSYYNSRINHKENFVNG